MTTEKNSLYHQIKKSIFQHSPTIATLTERTNFQLTWKKTQGKQIANSSIARYGGQL